MKTKLNFGCGNDFRKGWDNCDIQAEAPISFDANIFPYPLEDNKYTEIEIQSVIELLDNPDKCLFELWAKCKDGAIIKITSAYYNNKGLWNDIQTKHSFTDSTWKRFCSEPCVINKKNKFDILKLELIPSCIGKWIYPKWFREKLSCMIGGLISQVYVELRVNKKI